jgi:tetratricopeptide (TPR) repeat protein
MLLADIYMKNTKDFKSAEPVYREFIRHYPSDPAVGQMTLGLGLALFEQARYSEARKALRDIEKCPGVMNSTVSEAYYLTALSYEKAGQWETALGQFDLIQAKFPGMDKAYEAGFHVANYYREKNQKKLARSKYQETAEYISRYTNPETSNPLLASRSLGYLARCYTEMGELDKVIETLELLFNRYPLSRDGRMAPLRLADLYENEKHDYKNAARWLKEFIELNPDAGNLVEITNHISLLERK